MTEEALFRWSVLGFGALWGLVVGRAFALEADNRTTAVLAPAYCGAGAGLVSGPPFALLFILAAQLSKPETTVAVLLDALEAAGAAVLWGPLGGAAGGLLVGIVVAALKMYRFT